MAIGRCILGLSWAKRYIAVCKKINFIPFTVYQLLKLV